MARLRLDPVRGPLSVPEITVYFWLIKGLSTAMGESTSDYLVHAMAPEIAVGLGFVAFVGALALQFRQGRYRAWTYWFAVVMVGVFGTMAADVLHVGLSVPYSATSVLYAAALVVVFVMGSARNARCRSTASTLQLVRLSTGRLSLRRSPSELPSVT